MDTSQIITIATQMFTILVVGGGIIATFTTTRNNVTTMKDEMIDLKREIKKLAEVLISVARQEERMNGIDSRLLMQGQRIDELNKIQARTDSGRFDQLIDRFNTLITVMESRQ